MKVPHQLLCNLKFKGTIGTIKNIQITNKKEDTYIYIMKPGFEYHLPSESYLIKSE